MNWGAMAQNLETSININNASGNTIYSNTEAYGLLNPGDSMSLYHSNKFLPNAIGEHIIEYEVLGDSIDATPFDNILEKGFFVTDTIFNPYYPNSNQTDVIGTGHFTGGDDGFKMANLISLLEADEITSVRIGLNRSQSDYYNTVPGGMVQISIFDTTGFYSAGGKIQLYFLTSTLLLQMTQQILKQLFYSNYIFRQCTG